MSGGRIVWEVARREIVERSRSRALRVTLVLLVLLSAGAAVAGARFTGQTPTDHVALVGARSVALADAIRLEAHAAGRRVKLPRLASDDAARRAVHNGSVDAALLDGRRILVRESRSEEAVRVVQDAVAASGVIARLRATGLTAAQAIGVLTPAGLPVSVLEPRARNYDRNQGMVAVGLFALFMALVFFGQAVAQGVTEEKSSRVVELVLATLSPRRLLAGKVLGIGLLGLVLLLIPGLAALLAGTLAGGAGLPAAAPQTIALIVLWFILGYAFYSVAFAAVGALVSRQEDLNTAMLPVNAVLIGAFYLALAVTNTNPNGTLARVVAFVPPISPLVVPARVVLGDMGALALAATIILEVLATAGLIVVASRTYARSILQIGAPIKLRHAFGRRRPPTVAAPSNSRSAHQRDRTGLALRLGAIGLVVAGAAIGFGNPVGVVVTAIGLLLVAVAVSRGRHT